MWSKRILLIAVVALIALCAVGCKDEGWTGPTAAYVIRAGDTLSELALRFEIPGGWQTLADLNDLSNPNRLEVGDEILLPVHPRFPHDELARSSLPRFQEAWTEAILERFSDLAAVGVVVRVPLDDGQILLSTSSDGDLIASTVGPTGQIGISWQRAMVPNSGEYDVVSVDLDGDGNREVIVSTLWRCDENLPLCSWEVAVIESLGAHTPPLRFRTDQIRNFPLLQNGQAHDLVAQEWRRLFDGARGPGLYLQARRYRYRDGELRPTDTAGVPSRRLLESFSLERFPTTALAWLSEAELWPYDLTPARRPVEATLTGFSEINSSLFAAPLVYECTLSSDDMGTAVEERFSYGMDAADPFGESLRFGFVEPGLLLPRLYRPANPRRLLNLPLLMFSNDGYEPAHHLFF